MPARGSGSRRATSAHSAASPMVPTAAPLRRAKRKRPLARNDQADPLDAERLDDVEREVGDRLAQHRPDHERDRAANDEEERHGAERGAATQPDAHRDQRHGRGEHDQHRAEHEPELRDAVVELALEGREADQQAARHRVAAQLHEPAEVLVACGAGALCAPALDLKDRDPDQRHDGAADQHQMRGTPEGHVLPEQPVPAVVEREPGEREGARRADQESAQRRVPVAGDPHASFRRSAHGGGTRRCTRR